MTSQSTPVAGPVAPVAPATPAAGVANPRASALETASLARRLLLLNGIGIVGVVINHAIQYGSLMLVDWPAGGVLPPAQTIALLGWARYYVLLTLEKLPVFCVPAFLFTSGFFVAYAARGEQGPRYGHMIRARLTGLLIPYLIWSAVVFAMDIASGEALSPGRIVARLVYGGAVPHYYYVPLLCQFYLLAPWFAAWARKHGTQLLLGAAVVQAVANSFKYLALFWDHPALEQILFVTSKWSIFPLWVFFFALGVVFGFQPANFRAWLLPRRKWLLVWTALLFILSVAEADWVYRLAGVNWRSSPLTLMATLYALAFLLTFLAFEQVRWLGNGALMYLSRRTYGIYLVHSKVVFLTASLIGSSLPNLVGQQWAVQVILLAAGLGLPVLLMEGVARTRLRVAYRYLFG